MKFVTVLFPGGGICNTLHLGAFCLGGTELMWIWAKIVDRLILLRKARGRGHERGTAGPGRRGGIDDGRHGREQIARDGVVSSDHQREFCGQRVGQDTREGFATGSNIIRCGGGWDQ